jgi:tRNA pseudouridine13 synthase
LIRRPIDRPHEPGLPERRQEVYNSPVPPPLSLASSLIARLSALPFATTSLPAIEGRLKVAPEDFEVEELPAYLPSGSGEHLYLWIEKRELTTVDAVKELCGALGARFETAGWAGLKDKQAVSRQWLSLHVAATPNAAELAFDRLRVLAVSRHGNKLRSGHLRGNRFVLRLADVPEAHDVHARAVLAALGEHGMPNYYGAQRFGHAGRNVHDAYAWLAQGGRAPGKPFLRKLLVSALQAALFNVCLGKRLARGQLGAVLEGDVLRKEDTGGLFVCADPTQDAARAERWEISPTGPMFGARMKSPSSAALALESELLTRWDIDAACLARAQKFGEGTRRVLRVRPERLGFTRQGSDLVLEFDLPRGSYATVLVEELTKTRGLSWSGDALE